MKKKNEIIRIVSKKTGFRIADVREVINTLLDTVWEVCLEKDCVRLGFLEIGSKLTKEKENFDPLTQQYKTIPPRYIPYVRLGEGYKRKYRHTVKD